MEDRDAWCAAVWRVTHARARRNGTGRGSLAFQTFPECVAARVKAHTVPEAQKVAVVGLAHHDYKGDLARFDGRVVPVRFELVEFEYGLRMAAVVDGKTLGLVSKETPVRQGNGSWTLATQGAVVYATPVLA